MPTYEYRCANGHDFEEFFLKMSAAKSEVPCPTCGLLGERRLSAGGGLVFKGSGFYITDYGKDGKKATASPPSGNGKGGAAASGAKGEGSSGESAASDSSKGDSSKSSDAKPAPSPSTPPAKGSE